MSKEQYKGIHDVVNDQGFAMHDFKHGQPFGSRKSIQQSKRMDIFSYLGCFRNEDLSYGFLEEHKVCVNNQFIDPQHSEMKSRLWELNQNFLSPRNKC